MKITLSAAIMAHPARQAQVDYLHQHLDREVPVVWDQIQNRWDTGKRAMLAFDPDCTHHVVIQDDVLVCRDLLAGIEMALACVPEDVAVCGYLGRLRPHANRTHSLAAACKREKASWCTMHTLNWGPLIVVPTAVIPEMIAYSDPLDFIPNYDRRLSRYFDLGIRRRVWYSWPSLVDHADGPSLVPGRGGTDRAKAVHTRVAHLFLGEDVSALDVDWSGPVVHATSNFTAPVDKRVRPGQVAFRNKINGAMSVFDADDPRVADFASHPRWKREEVPA